MDGLAVLKNPRALFELLKETYNDWSEDKASRLAAALAYYTAFSVAPLLLITIAIAGLVFGREAAQGQVYAQLEGLLGSGAASAIQTGIAQSGQTGAGTISAIIGIATLIWSASNVFAQLQEALNTVWEVQPDPNAGILATLKRRFLSMTMVLGIGFLLLVSLVLSAAISAVGNFFGNLLPGGAILWQAVNFLLSLALITLLFAAIYKILPDATVDWGDVWIGAVVTALLFTVGKLLIGLYLGHASVGSTFGAAGSLLVFLVWVYYSAQILFFGAEFTQVYARRYGSRIVPAEGAVSVSEEARAKEGIPHRETVERAAARQSRTRQERQPVLAGQADGHAYGGSVATAERPATAGAGHTNGAAHTNGTASALVDARGAGPAARAHDRAQASGRRRQRGSGGTSGAPNAVKKLMWAGLVSGTMAVGTVAARRASSEVWRALFHEDPPTKNV